MCNLCNNTKIVYVKKREVMEPKYPRVEATSENPEVDNFEFRTIGGVDICPLCREKSEVEYLELKGSQI